MKTFEGSITRPRKGCFEVRRVGEWRNQKERTAPARANYSSHSLGGGSRATVAWLDGKKGMLRGVRKRGHLPLGEGKESDLNTGENQARITYRQEARKCILSKKILVNIY